MLTFDPHDPRHATEGVPFDVLAQVRNADALLHVVRAFPAPDQAAAPDPAREVTALEEELVLADLEVLERRVEKLEKGLKRKLTDV